MRRAAIHALSWLAVCLLLLGVGGSSGERPRSSATAAAASLPANGLCAFIDSTAAAKLLTGTAGASVISAPVQPAPGQLAQCDFAGEGAFPAAVVKISLAKNVQSGADTFAQLRNNPALIYQNVNGIPLVWDVKRQQMYVRFMDTNPAFSNSPRGEESVLTISNVPFVCDFYVQSSPSPDELEGIRGSMAEFATRIGDTVNGGKVLNPPSVDPTPMLIDDQGRQVPNPTLVINIYIATLSTDAFSLHEYGCDPSPWPNMNKPYLRDAAIRAKIRSSMTAHPNCDTGGCVYPGFVVTGWNSDIAREDGRKLGIDPVKVPHPEVGDLVVYTSNFAPCMCYWKGSYFSAATPK